MWIVLSVEACSEMDSSFCRMLLQWDKMIVPCLVWLQFLSQQWCKTLTKCQWATTAPQRVIKRTNATSDHWWKMTRRQLCSENKKKKQKTQEHRNTFFVCRAAFNCISVLLINIVPRLWDILTQESLKEESVSISFFHCSKSIRQIKQYNNLCILGPSSRIKHLPTLIRKRVFVLCFFFLAIPELKKFWSPCSIHIVRYVCVQQSKTETHFFRESGQKVTVVILLVDYQTSSWQHTLM